MRNSTNIGSLHVNLHVLVINEENSKVKVFFFKSLALAYEKSSSKSLLSQDF